VPDVFPPSSVNCYAVLYDTAGVLHWGRSRSTDTKGYYIYRDNVVVDSVFSLSDTSRAFKVPNVRSTYVFSVAAVDTAGNRSARVQSESVCLDPIAGTNLASVKPVLVRYADTRPEAIATAYADPAAITDKSAQTYFYLLTKQQGTQFILDLRATRLVNRANFRTFSSGQFGIRGATLESGTDTSNMHIVATVTYNGATSNEVFFATDTARFLRLTITIQDSMTGTLLSEWEVYGIPKTDVTEERPMLPTEFALAQNYPNPFNPATTIEFALPVRSRMTLNVFNALGQRVMTLIDGEKEAGYHQFRFDATGLSSGVYFYRLKAGLFVETKKLVLLR
jgi:hypothetical protein